LRELVKLHDEREQPRELERVRHAPREKFSDSYDDGLRRLYETMIHKRNGDGEIH
jgi:hypothetical protein